ncbi:MAG TPA: oligogalacturonate lyase family protein [Planctomycetota bacterium]|nr:oligogalacturonate lyase family protein [Planctomycetota bacterium]
MAFCHEGPWQRVDNRIWGLDIETRRAWKIRPTAPGECVGHEYWMSDGEHIGYHGGNASLTGGLGCPAGRGCRPRRSHRRLMSCG